jgi:hypothetical protein
MAVPEQTRHRLSEWCAARIPETERAHRQIGFTIQGSDVTITDRRAPSRPELGGGWTTTPLARLRLDDAGGWSLHRSHADGGWEHIADGDDPIALLASVAERPQAPA